MGHARAVLPLTQRRQQVEVARMVVGDGLSVRQTESLVRQLLTPRPETSQSGNNKSSAGTDPNVTALQQDLSERLGAKVLIQQGSGGKGRLVVSYNSLDELDGILTHIR
jgi:ParB family chromosome partitioning protein